MKEYVKIVTKEGAIESTIDIGSLINKRVVSLKGFVVGRIKKIKINTKLFVEGIVVSRGIFKNPLYLGSSYLGKLSEEAIILSIDPFVLYNGMKVLTNEGDVIGKIKDIARKNNTNDIGDLVVKAMFRKKFNVDKDFIKSIGSSIILKSNYSAPKKYFWQRS